MVNRRHCVVGMGQNWVPLEMNVKSLSFLKSLVLGVLESEISTHPKNDASLFPIEVSEKLCWIPKSSPCWNRKSHGHPGLAFWGWNPTPTPGFTLPAAEVSSPRGKKEKHEEVNMWNTAVGTKFRGFLASLWWVKPPTWANRIVGASSPCNWDCDSSSEMVL